MSEAVEAEADIRDRGREVPEDEREEPSREGGAEFREGEP